MRKTICAAGAALLALSLAACGGSGGNTPDNPAESILTGVPAPQESILTGVPAPQGDTGDNDNDGDSGSDNDNDGS